MHKRKIDSIVSKILEKRGIKEYQIISGLDPTAMVLDIGKSVLKIAEMDMFYAEMHMHALEDIHYALSQIHVAPQLMYMDYIDGYVITEFEKIEKSEEIVSSFEAGCALGKAHSALKNIEVRKAFPWDGFYGEKAEFLCIVPLVKNDFIRKTAHELLKYVTVCRKESEHAQYIHRDLNPNNIIKSPQYTYLIDWDMAYGGYIQDDVAMSICCLGPMAQERGISLESHCENFLNGYKEHNNVERVYLESEVLISAVALAGLRQGVSGWFSDRGNLSEAYWINIMKRMEISLSLCINLNKS